MKKKAKARRHAKTRQQAPGKATFRALVISLGLVLITWLVFGQTGRHDFVNYDDRVYVYDNHQIMSGLTLFGLFAVTAMLVIVLGATACRPRCRAGVRANL